MALANLSICYTWKNIKSAYNNNKFKISAPTWNDEFDLPVGSYFISNFQDYFEYIIKRHETIANNLPMQIYMNKIKTRIIFIIKSGYKLDLLPPEDKNCVPKLESVEVILVHCNLVNNNYQEAFKVLFTFVPNKQFSQLINISPHSLAMLNKTNKEFYLLKYDLLIKITSNLKLNIMLI